MTFYIRRLQNDLKWGDTVAEIEKKVDELFNILDEGRKEVERIVMGRERAYERNYDSCVKLAKEGKSKAIGAFIQGVEAIYAPAIERTREKVFDKFMEKAKEIAQQFNAAVIYNYKHHFDPFTRKSEGREITFVTVIIPLVENPDFNELEKNQFIEYHWSEGDRWVNYAIWDTRWRDAKGKVVNIYNL